MSFKIKAMVASFALVASFNANAISTTTGELFIVAYDSVGKNSFISTLGLGSVSDFVTNNSISAPIDFSTSANSSAAWASFTAAASTNLSSVKYSVLGLDSNYTALVTGAGMFGPQVATNAQLDNLMVAAGGVSTVRTFMSVDYAALTDGVNAAFVGNNDGTLSATTPGINMFNLLGTNLNTQGTIGSNNIFYSLTESASSEVTKTLLGNWNLATNGTLSYTSVAAVPEADTSAMMIAGLGLMGFIARRRNNKLRSN